MNNKYQLVDYDLQFRDGIVRLLNDYLWSGTFNRNLEYFIYKYEQNPYRVDPIGLVVLSGKDVVGFRAFFPSKWQIGNDTNNLIPMLSPTDTVVHPEHQRQGLFGEMIKASFKRFGPSKCGVFINLSANAATKHGLLKNGWRMLSPIMFARNYSCLSLLNYFLTYKLKLRGWRSEPAYGRFGDIEASNLPRSKEMAALLNLNNKLPSKLYLYKDEHYLTYRYRIPYTRYHFFYYWGEDGLEGFVSVRSIGHTRNAHIIDYAYKSEKAIETLLEFIIQRKFFDIISIWRFGLPRNIYRSIFRTHFKVGSLITRMKDKSKYLEFGLVRPTKETVAHADWFVSGYDLGNINTWDFREICADDS